jgi:hypothetical protein
VPFRPSPETRRQLDWLNERFGTDQTVITVAIDRMYREETMNTETAARQRVNATPELAVYEDIIFYDWPNWDEHLEWVATAPVEEIVQWAATVRRDEANA